MQSSKFISVHFHSLNLKKNRQSTPQRDYNETMEVTIINLRIVHTANLHLNLPRRRKCIPITCKFPTLKPISGSNLNLSIPHNLSIFFRQCTLALFTRSRRISLPQVTHPLFFNSDCRVQGEFLVSLQQ